MSNTYRVGLIGCGRKGHGHARGYVGNPRTELVAAADPDGSNLEIFLDRHAVVGYADYHEMLAKEQIDIAVPILPVRPNPQVVIDCARAGVKAIYCEKPIGDQPGRIRRHGGGVLLPRHPPCFRGRLSHHAPALEGQVAHRLR